MKEGIWIIGVVLWIGMFAAQAHAHDRPGYGHASPVVVQVGYADPYFGFYMGTGPWIGPRVARGVCSRPVYRYADRPLYPGWYAPPRAYHRHWIKPHATHHRHWIKPHATHPRGFSQGDPYSYRRGQGGHRGH